MLNRCSSLRTATKTLQPVATPEHIDNIESYILNIMHRVNFMEKILSFILIKETIILLSDQEMINVITF